MLSRWVNVADVDVRVLGHGEVNLNLLPDTVGPLVYPNACGEASGVGRHDDDPLRGHGLGEPEEADRGDQDDQGCSYLAPTCLHAFLLYFLD